MLDSLAEFTKSLLIPGTLTFLLFGLTLGVMLAYGPRRTRRAAMPLLALLAGFYWLGSIPIVADALATRFHVRVAGQLTLMGESVAPAIAVLGSCARSS